MLDWLNSSDQTMPPQWAAAVVTAFGLFALIQAVATRGRRVNLDRRMIWTGQAVLAPLFIVGAQALLMRGLEVDKGTPLGAQIALLADILLWLVGAWIVVTGLDTFVWKGVVRRRLGVEVPGLLTNLVAVAVYMAAACGIIAFALDRSLVALVVSSGVVAAIVGLAIQGTLSDLFAGLAISIEGSYRIGDHIELEDGRWGQVIDITWRSTRILSRHKTVYVLPNSKAAGGLIHNLDRPEKTYAHFVYLFLPAEVPPPLARRLLLEACLSSEAVLSDPPPVVRLWDISKRPYEYMVYVHFRNYPEHFRFKDDLLLQIWSHLNRAGITPAAPGQDTYFLPGKTPKVVEPGAAELLAEIKLFKALSDDERVRLLESVQVRGLRSGDVIVQQGSPGDSLYVVSAGVVRVTRALVGREPLEIARLGQGRCFGEMSLLTGEPRSANISALTDCQLLEIGKRALDPILQTRPEIIEQLAAVMADRRLKNEEADERGDRPRSDLLREYASEMVTRIRAFFSTPHRSDRKAHPDRAEVAEGHFARKAG